MAKTFHVALLIETSREYGRGLLRGVARHQREHGPWSIFFEPRGLGDAPPSWLAEWEGDGILARITSPEIADAIRATGLPAIDVRGSILDSGLSFIGVDNEPVAEIAYSHLRDCGLRHFAFCGTPRGENPNQDLRCDYFVKRVEDDGRECAVWLGEQTAASSATWEDQQDQIAAWLLQLPKPVGIMTCHDDRGQQVLDACRRASLAVPDEVAVVSVDNDPFLCNLCTPPLTSIDVNPSRIGYEAALLLDQLMRGNKAPPMRTLLGPPRGLAARRSTDMIMIDDQEVADAIRFIREHATEGIKASEVVSRARRSPSTLERRVKETLGRTIKSEITRVRLTRAKLLLSETEYTVSKVSSLAGYSEPKYFCEVFRKHEGMTPTHFRKCFRDE